MKFEMIRVITRYRLIILTLLNSFFIVSSNAQPSHFGDSIRNELVRYLDTIASYEQALTILSEKKQLDSFDHINFSLLWKKKERFKDTIDKLKLSLAELYNSNDLPGDALPVFVELRSSKDAIIRNRAVVASDSLIIKKKQVWYEKYPWTSFPFKSILPWLCIYPVFLLIFFIINKRKNKGRLSIICHDNLEREAFMSSIKYERNKMQSQWLEDQESGVVPPGPFGLLPYLDIDESDGVKNLVSANVPSNLAPAISFLWTAGIKPLYTLRVLIEQIENQVVVYAQLAKGQEIICEWDKTVARGLLPGTRLDIAYEALMQIKFAGQA